MNIKSLILLGLIFLSMSCQTNQSNKKKIIEKNDNKSSHQLFSIEDSLEKYFSTDSVLITHDSSNYKLYIGKEEHCNYAVFIVPDSILIFYQHQKNEKWKATDTLIYNLDFSYSDLIDLNGDGYRDIKVSCFSGAAGNTENSVFLFDPKSNLFKHNTFYDLPNIEYDVKGHFIKSWWFAGVVHCQEKWKYKITEDSLTFDIGVRFCPDIKTNGNFATIEYFNKKNKKEITTKKISGKSNQLISIFEESLYDARFY